MSNSQRWLKEHFSDPFVKKAQKEGYVSRAAYKLIELDEKDHLFKSGMVVLDLGAAPGGWTQVAAERVGTRGRVVAVDCLPLTCSPSNTQFIQGDFNEESVWTDIQAAVTEVSASGLVEVVLSDMAPNLSGNKSLDQPRSLHLVELAYEAARLWLRPGGTFLIKMFEGYGVQELIKEWRRAFKQVKIRKPQASRARSSEIYVLAVGLTSVAGSLQPPLRGV